MAKVAIAAARSGVVVRGAFRPRCTPSRPAWRITRSTVQTRETIKMEDGAEYPLFKVEVSSESHPFYTGAQQRVIETGRVEKFRQKFGARANVTTRS